MSGDSGEGGGAVGDVYAIDMGKLETRVPLASEPELVPTTSDSYGANPESLSFVSVEGGPSAGLSEETAGEIASPESQSGAEEGIRSRRGGKAGQFLESKGFGWLLEVDDDGEEDKPLL